jgi:hypothetical protein
MQEPTLEHKSIVVAGDLTIDWNLIFDHSASDSTSLWMASNMARACSQPGGVAMLTQLLETITVKLNKIAPARIFSHRLSKNPIHPSNRSYNHSYAIWSKMGDKANKAWRVTQFLGIDEAKQFGEKTKWGDEPEKADLIVVDDANRGFRNRPDLWPEVLKKHSNRPWIVLKYAYPVADGELWKQLIAEHADQMVVVVAANDLRLSNAQISRGLSWERIAQDTLWELTYNPVLKELSKCAYVIVPFQTDGALIVSHTERGLEGNLLFDPELIENGWASKFEGGMVGYNTCLMAAIVKSILLKNTHFDKEDILSGTRSGLSAMRALHLKGFEVIGTPLDIKITFPYQMIADEIEKPTQKYALSPILNPLSLLNPSNTGTAALPHNGTFTILSQQCSDDLLKLARTIIRENPEKALANIPLGKFGDLLTVDRNEIESYRTISALIQEYINQEKVDKPISIAVFGSPGSGKSFGIKQIAKSINKERVTDITFNLSQMNSPTDLIGALHQVRDEGLKGKIPLVFWDEFDSSLENISLGWLRYFLAPMQDGSFLEGQVTHPIGRAIFVFAGGTCERMEEFGKKLDSDPAKNEEKFRAVKGPDFKSRLKGFINILGPNPRKGVNDPYYIIRRAILLSSIFHRQMPKFYTPNLQIDENLLDAFLETKMYWHGVRSMESIIAMSQLSGKTRFERSSLPPISQLNLHVTGWEFMSRVQKINFEGEALDKLAHAVHEDYCEYIRADGFIHGEKTDETANFLTHSSLVSFEDLPDDEKTQNIQNALSIPEKVASVGYVMIHARTNEPPTIFPDRDIDVLAEAEHNRWVKSKIAQDSRWHYAEKTDKSLFEHSCLLPWNSLSDEKLAEKFSTEERKVMGHKDLPEDEKEKDRLFIRRIPHILARVGYTVIKLENGE